MKLSTIMDGISRDPAYAFRVMNETGIEYSNIQYAWDKEIGEHSEQEMKTLKKTADEFGIGIAAVTPHTFGGVAFMDVSPGTAEYLKHIDYLKRTIESAHILETANVRIHSCRKEVVTWGENGADRWLARNNVAWGKLIEFMQIPAKIAEDEGVTLTVETTYSGMVCSGYTAKKFIEDLGSPNVKVCWDFPNTLVWHDVPYPDAYELIKDVIGEVHVKDLVSDSPKSTVKFYQLGKGDAGPYFEGIADALRRDGYDGFVVLEGTWRPDGEDFEHGYLKNVPIFKKIFG
jgi:sugar phosphate isomerase/epimerase